jgi:hypothetical protein
MLLELGLQRRDAAVEFLPLVAHLDDQGPDPVADIEVRIGEHRVERLVETRRPLRHDMTALEQDRPQLVDQRLARIDQPRAHPVQRLQVELRLALQFHEAHRRPGRRLGDRLRVPVVVFLRLHVGPDILRRHQPHLVPLAVENAAEMMRAAARFHRHHATRKPGRKPDQRLMPHATAQHDRARRIDADDAAQVLAQIDTQDHNVHGSLLSLKSAPAS